MPEQTLPQFLVRNAREFPRDPALREKDRGIWQQWTWAEYLAHVRAIALGLVSLGFERGDKVALLSDNRPELYAAMLAVQAAGGVPDDPKGLRHYKDPLLLSLEQLEKRGHKLDAERPGLFDELVATGKPGDISLICYTSGTTGVPKGAVFSHANWIHAIEGILQLERYERTDEVLAYLPAAWIGDTFWSLAGAVIVGFTVNCPERPETVLENLKEIGPQVLVAPPRIWENLVSLVQVKMEDASWVKRRLFRWLMPVGEEVARRRMEKRSVPPGLRALNALGEFFVFGPLRDHLGFRRTRYAYTGGAPLGPEVFLFFRAIGINLKQVYGQTEISGVSCVQRDGDVKLGTVGKPFPNTELRLTEAGEVITRSPGVFLGYYKNPEATAQTIRDGWLYSGDAAMFDQDGHLIVIDRAKDVTHLSDGTKFAPQYIENKLKFSAYIKEAVAVGQDRDYVAAMVNIDMENVGKWAERRRTAYTTYADLAQKREVYDLIAQEVERVNRDLPEETRIRKYVLLHKELDADDEEVTRTRKVRRGFVAKKYADIIEALFSERPSVAISTVITYQDGRQATLQTDLAIRTVGATARQLAAV